MSELVVFIEGETIDLIVPTRQIAETSDWHTWLNDPSTTRYNNHGIFPKTRDDQIAYVQAINKPGGSVFALNIATKQDRKLVGVCALQSINYTHRSAEYSACMTSKGRSRDAIFHGLEAKARMTTHGFERLGLERIYGGQVAALADWQKLILLLGFKPEGHERQAFRKGTEVYDVARNACTLDDYLALKDLRGSDYWPGKRRMMELIRSLPKDSVVDRVKDAIDNELTHYMQSVQLA